MIEELKLPDNTQETITNVSKVFQDTIIDLNRIIERPPIVISIGYDDRSYKGVHYPLKFGSRGNFSVISGEEKSRKSFVKSLIEACSVGGGANNYTGNLEIKSYFKPDEWIISIDGEQSEYDVWSNGNRIRKMCGDIPNTYKILMWREKSRKERLELLDWLFMKSPFKDKIGLVMLDGFVDFVYDPNDQTESNTFIDLIMKYSSIADCHISGILHVNPNSEKMRGHFGTIASQRAECVTLVKNEGDYSTVSCKRVRGSKPFKDFTIRIDPDWMPYISEDKEDILI
jgi:hypothetical protein